MSGRCVHLSHLRKICRTQPFGRTDQSGPQTPVDEGDLAADETAHEDVAASPHSPRGCKDLAASRMRPPAATNTLSGDRVSQRGNCAMRRLEHDAVFSNEAERLLSVSYHGITAV